MSETPEYLTEADGIARLNPIWLIRSQKKQKDHHLSEMNTVNK
jgi:hypothetical protein